MAIDHLDLGLSSEVENLNLAFKKIVNKDDMYVDLEHNTQLLLDALRKIQTDMAALFTAFETAENKINEIIDEVNP